MIVSRDRYEDMVRQRDYWRQIADQQTQLLLQALTPKPAPDPGPPTVQHDPLPEPVVQAMIARAQPGSAAWRRLRKFARDAHRAGQSDSLIAEHILNGAG